MSENGRVLTTLVKAQLIARKLNEDRKLFSQIDIDNYATLLLRIFNAEKIDEMYSELMEIKEEEDEDKGE